MAREPEELVRLWCALGAQLTTFRVAADLSQSQLAGDSHYHRTAVCHIEKGRAHGTERFWTIADERCGANGALLAAFHAVQAAKHDHEARLRQAQLDQARATASALRAIPAGSPVPPVSAGTVDKDRCLRTVEDQSMKRREAIGLAAKIAVGAGLSTADRAILDTPAGASPIPTRIGASDVARVEAMSRSMMAQDKAMGGGSCRDAVLGCLDWAEQLRGATMSDTVRQSLDAELSRLQTLAGWTSGDVCLPVSAQRCYLRALESARLAGQPLLAAHALGNLGTLYLQAGHFEQALQLLRLGSMSAQKSAPPGMLASLALDEAWAHAGLGDADETQRALQQAEAHYARALEEPHEWVGTAVLPDHSDLPAGRANAYSQLANHDPRYAEAAVADMTEALTLRDPSRTRAMLWGRITLAANQYRCGAIEAANADAERVLATAGQVSSRRTTRDLVTLGEQIRRHTTDSAAADLARRISTTTAG